MDVQTLTRIREMLNQATPLVADCGAYCGAACCGADEEGQGGVHLFPGEEAFYQNADWAEIRPSGWIRKGSDVPMLVCRGHCPRENRPLGCRIFPLSPKVSGDKVDAVMDRRAMSMCPLAGQGVPALSQSFVRAVKSALQAVADAGELEFLADWQKLMEQYLWL